MSSISKLLVSVQDQLKLRKNKLLGKLSNKYLKYLLKFKLKLLFWVKKIKDSMLWFKKFQLLLNQAQIIRYKFPLYKPK